MIFEAFGQTGGPTRASRAAPASGCRSAAAWRRCWVAHHPRPASRGEGSTFTLVLPRMARTRRVTAARGHGATAAGAGGRRRRRTAARSCARAASPSAASGGHGRRRRRSRGEAHPGAAARHDPDGHLAAAHGRPGGHPPASRPTGARAHIPVLAVTAHALSSARDQALEAGCDAVITKPFFAKDLEREVRRHLGRQGTRRSEHDPPTDCDRRARRAGAPESPRGGQRQVRLLHHRDRRGADLRSHRHRHGPGGGAHHQLPGHRRGGLRHAAGDLRPDARERARPRAGQRGGDARFTVIPMSFGTVFKTREDIVELLRSRLRRLPRRARSR